MTDLGVLQICATITSVLLSVAPLGDTIPEIKRTRTTGDRSPHLYVAIWANALLWIDYGIFVNAFHPIATTNLVGFLSGSYFLFVFHQYAPSLARVQFAQCLTAAACMVAAVYSYSFLFPSADSTTKSRLGAMCCLVTIGVYASPLGTVVRAVQLKSSKPISLFFALVGSCNSLLWTGYGLLTDDPWVYAPNIVGAVLSLAQVGAFALYRNGRKGCRGAVGASSGGGAKRSSLSEFLLEQPPHGAGSSPAVSSIGGGGGQQVTLL